MDFIGTECIVCKKIFVEEDDIVVCEVCGTPYHRDCYSAFGKCINYEYHTNGWKFNQRHKNLQDSQTFEHANTEIQSEKFNNKIEKEFVNNDDNKYDDIINVSRDFLKQSKLDPNQEFSKVSLLEFYLYSKSFNNTKRFYKSNIGETTFSLFAILFPELFMISKRLYVPAILIYLIEFALSIPLVVASYSNVYEILVNILSENVFFILRIITLVLLCTFKVFVADRCLKLYINDCVKKIRAIKSDAERRGQSEKVFLKRLILKNNRIGLLEMFLMIFCGNILYSYLYIISNLLFMYFGG